MSLIILEIPGVVGECDVEKYEGMIICDSLTQGATLEIEPSQNQRRTMHVPKVNNIAINRKFDKASPNLLRGMLTGQVGPAPWKIHCLRSLGDDSSSQVEFLTIILAQPLLATHNLNISEGDTTEDFEINAVEITWIYNPSDSMQKQQGQFPFGFNTLKGKLV